MYSVSADTESVLKTACERRFVVVPSAYIRTVTLVGPWVKVWFHTPTASIVIALAGVKDEPMVVSAPKAPLEAPVKVSAELKSALATPAGTRSRQQPSTIPLKHFMRLSLR